MAAHPQLYAAPAAAVAAAPADTGLWARIAPHLPLIALGCAAILVAYYLWKTLRPARAAGSPSCVKGDKGCDDSEFGEDDDGEVGPPGRAKLAGKRAGAGDSNGGGKRVRFQYGAPPRLYAGRYSEPDYEEGDSEESEYEDDDGESEYEDDGGEAYESMGEEESEAASEPSEGEGELSDEEVDEDPAVVGGRPGAVVAAPAAPAEAPKAKAKGPKAV